MAIDLTITPSNAAGKGATYSALLIITHIVGDLNTKTKVQGAVIGVYKAHLYILASQTQCHCSCLLQSALKEDPKF